MKIEDLYSIYLSQPNVCTDSRKIIPGGLFFALKGSNFDGNKFAKEAIKNGSKYAIVDDINLAGSKQIIVVKDALSTLQNLATFHRNELNIPIIAITGSNGKTTTKELISAILSLKYNVGATHGNLNNHIGVPLTLLSFNKITEIGIVEIGANHVGEISNLCKIASPNYGLITNIGKAHIKGFGSFKKVLEAKTELYRYLTENNGKIFCNANDTLLVSQCKKINCDKVFYGNKYGEVNGSIIKNNPFLKIKIWDSNYSTIIDTQLIGSYNLENILAALCIGKYFGIDIKQSMNQIKSYKPDNMRSQWLNTKRNNIVVDAYNANPTSMKLSIDNFISLDLDNKVYILGDMLELGKIEEQEHIAIIKLIESLKIEKVILVGKIFKNLTKTNSIKSYENVDQLIKSNILQKINNSNILLKGSRNLKLEKIINYL